MTKKLEIEVTYLYEIEIDTNNSTVKEYDSEKELIDNLTSYHFEVLPVIGDGVEVKDTTLLHWDLV